VSGISAVPDQKIFSSQEVNNATLHMK